MAAGNEYDPKVNPYPTLTYHITYDAYVVRGFTLIPENRFGQFIVRAGLYAQEHTLERVIWSYILIPQEQFSELEERNIRGICELAEAFYGNDASRGESGAPVISFSNEGYSEKYEGASSNPDLFNVKLRRILDTYFVAWQTSRRGGTV